MKFLEMLMRRQVKFSIKEINGKKKEKKLLSNFKESKRKQEKK